MAFLGITDAKVLDLLLWEMSPQGRPYIEYMLRVYKWSKRAKRKP